MADLRITACQPGRPRVPVRPLPEQTRRRTAPAPASRIVRQVEAVDAWVAARREREQALHAPSMSRDERMDVAREVDALRRTHDAIRVRCARALGPETEPLRAGPTAVVAHRHAWFVDTLALLLGEHDVTVLASTDNAADALGAVVAEQPDVVLVGECLAMLPVAVLLRDIRRFAPRTLLAVAASDLQRSGDWRAHADAVFSGHQPPREVADTLSALCAGAA